MLLNLSIKRCTLIIFRRFLSVGIQAKEQQTLLDEETKKWHLASAVCLERFPVVGAPLDDMQQKVNELFAQIEVEKSLFSDHEMKDFYEKKKKEKDAKRREKEGEEQEEKAEIVVTAKEFEEACMAELKLFQFSPTTTDADKSQDKKSLQRALTRKLTLVVQQKNLNKVKWQFPQAIRKPSESLREAAERALKELVSPNETFTFYGNAPLGFIKLKYSKATREKLNALGVKVFFFKAQLTKNDFNLQKCDDISDYLWLTHDEVRGIVGKDYYTSCSHLFFE